MKHLSLIFTLLLLSIFTGFGYAEEVGNKFYCRAGQIEVTDTTILLHLEHETVELDCVRVDQGGVYYTDEMIRCVTCRRPINPKNTCECPIAFKR